MTSIRSNMFHRNIIISKLVDGPILVDCLLLLLLRQLP